MAAGGCERGKEKILKGGRDDDGDIADDGNSNKTITTTTTTTTTTTITVAAAAASIFSFYCVLNYLSMMYTHNMLISVLLSCSVTRSALCVTFSVFLLS